VLPQAQASEHATMLYMHSLQARTPAAFFEDLEVKLATHIHCLAAGHAADNSGSKLLADVTLQAAAWLVCPCVHVVGTYNRFGSGLRHAHT